MVCSECGRVASIDLARKTALPFDERVSRLAPWQFLLPSVVVLGLLAATLLAITAGSIALQVAPSLSVLLWTVWGIVLFGSFGAVVFSLIVAMTSIVPNPIRAKRSAERAVVAMELLLSNGAAIFTLAVFGSGVAVILSVLFES